ncbi:MAG: class I SAM-dependent methyltransferase [Candidatus Latescibacteria bacterium]|nr:class I SAM-dependent methyltransferase [Candidatus Latescibacterota bacterium]
MEQNKIISEHNEEAKIYDSQVKEYDSYGHDVIFGMCFEFVKSNEKLLDLGIGTGLASINFSKIGLKIYGIDASQEMLNVCKSKSFTNQLLLHNIADFPIPFDDSFFNHVICCGVLHFFDDLTGLFFEIKRVIRKNGIFAFTISPSNLFKNDEDYKDFIESPTGWGVSIYKHSQEYINNLLKNSGFELIKEQRVLLKDADKIEHNMEFSVLVTRCL